MNDDDDDMDDDDDLLCCNIWIEGGVTWHNRDGTLWPTSSPKKCR